MPPSFQIFNFKLEGGTLVYITKASSELEHLGTEEAMLHICTPVSPLLLFLPSSLVFLSKALICEQSHTHM